MTIKNHKLTAGIDKIVGGSGQDLFKAPLHKGAMTLDDQDVLNGGKGLDGIIATLADGKLAPTLKSIEKGIFTADGTVQTTIDLSHAAALSNVFLSNLNSQVADSKLYLSNAANVDTLGIGNFNNSYFELAGIDTNATKHFDLLLGGIANSTVAMFSPELSSFQRMDIHLLGADDITLDTTVGAKHMVIHADEVGGGSITIQPVFAMGAIHDVKVVGKESASVVLAGDANAALQSFNSKELHGRMLATFGGEHLHTVTNGAGDSYFELTDIGGTKHAPAEVKLGGGIDILTLDYAVDGETQHYDGGKGDDVIAFQGQGSQLNQIKNFETVVIGEAGGVYDLKGMHLDRLEIEGTAASTNIKHFSTDTTLLFERDMSNFLTVDVAGAHGAADPLNVSLDGVSVGTLIAGFNATNLSHLQIESDSSDNNMYLGNIGTAGEAISLKITGDAHLTLDMANASTTQIDYVKIADDAGVDLSGLVATSQAFASTGVKIIGGDGDDVLVGGNGEDTISTGRGRNIVEGSFGADIVNLLNGKGADTLAFEFLEGSSFGADHDTVKHFGASDIIDLSSLGSGLTFAGTVADMATGMADLSSSHVVAFFNVADHTLYVDLNHDQQFDSTHDMQIQLNGVDHFDSTSLLS